MNSFRDNPPTPGLYVHIYDDKDFDPEQAYCVESAPYSHSGFACRVNVDRFPYSSAAHGEGTAVPVLSVASWRTADVASFPSNTLVDTQLRMLDAYEQSRARTEVLRKQHYNLDVERQARAMHRAGKTLVVGYPGDRISLLIDLARRLGQFRGKPTGYKLDADGPTRYP